MRLNLGCGFNHLAGFVNVDRAAVCRPDLLVDLERTPWPWPDSSVDEIVADHALEHLGETTAAWLAIIQELWRIGKPDCRIRITVPHPRHDNFLHDPTHVRIVTPIGLAMFDQQRNLDNMQNGGQESALGLYNGVDLEVVEAGFDLLDPWRSAFMNGELSREQAESEMAQLNNVCHQIRIMLRVVKPCRGAHWLDQQAAPP